MTKSGPIIACSDPGMAHFLFPPERVQGSFWRRQWFWYGIALRRSVCYWRGHKLARVSYDHAVRPFDAIECKFCSDRFAIQHKESWVA